jgi:hypothetical protein
MIYKEKEYKQSVANIKMKTTETIQLVMEQNTAIQHLPEDKKRNYGGLQYQGGTIGLKK